MRLSDIMSSMQPYYALRLLAGLIFLAGTVLMIWNLYMTTRGGAVVSVAVPPVPEDWRMPAKAPANDGYSAEEGAAA